MGSSTVKHIQVAMSANTEAFDAGMTKASSSLKAMDRTADQTAKQMGKLTNQMQQGLITPKQYSEGIRNCERELNAIQAGFTGMSAAVERVNTIMAVAETKTQKYARAVDELNSLQRIGAMTSAQHATAMSRTGGMLTQWSELGGRRKPTRAVSGERGSGIMGSLTRGVATRLGMGEAGGTAMAMGGAVAAVAGVGFVTFKAAQAFGNLEERATKVGLIIDKHLVASIREFNREIKQLSIGWSQFIIGVEQLFAPFARFLGDSLAGWGTILEAIGKAASATDRYLRGISAIPAIPDSGLVKATSLGDRRRAVLNTVATKAAAEELEKQKRAGEAFTELQSTASARAMAGMDARATELRKTLEVALTPLEQMKESSKEIDALWSAGRLTLVERNQLLWKGAQALIDMDRKAEASRLAGVAKVRAEVAKKRLGDVTARAQAQLDAMLSGGRQRQISPAALEAGSGAAFSAFNQARLQQSESKNLLDVQRRALQFIQEMARRGIVLSAAKLGGAAA